MKGGKLFILDGILVFGSPWDIFLSLITKNGEDDVTAYETKYLAKYPYYHARGNMARELYPSLAPQRA